MQPNVVDEAPGHAGDEVQIFDVAEGLKKRGHLNRRVDLAGRRAVTSPSSSILRVVARRISTRRCDFERQDGRNTVRLPERLARWYQLDQLHQNDYALMPDGKPYRVRVSLKRDK
jgi:hypothetical protein